MGVCGSETLCGSAISKRKLEPKIKNEVYDELKDKIKSELKDEAKLEVNTGHKPIPFNVANKVVKAICKISIKPKYGKPSYGTGFFFKYSDSMKCLMTNYHVLNPSLENKNIEIELYNKKKMKLKFNNRVTKYMKRPKDIAMIEIKESDEIYKDIEFLDYDLNYTKNGYSIYKNVDVFSVDNPNGKDASFASGRIINIYEYEFDHNIPTDNGSSGCPIILLNNNINLITL